MFRATRLLAVALAAGAALAFSASAQNPHRVSNLIAMVDYSRQPEFKKGDWVQYDVQSGSVTGESERYLATLLVAGEERFWGDDGFWIETITEYGPEARTATATLMSYAVFQDSFPYARLTHYMRKVANGTGDGGIEEQLVARSITTTRVRKWLSRDDSWKTDTIGPDTVVTPLGTIPVIKVRFERGTGATVDIEDSTVYTESREYRTEYRSPLIPITHLAREEMETVQRRRAWRIGQSQEGAPFQLLSQSTLSARAVQKGPGGIASMVLPQGRQKSLREWFPAEFANKKPHRAP